MLINRDFYEQNIEDDEAVKTALDCFELWYEHEDVKQILKTHKGKARLEEAFVSGFLSGINFSAELFKEHQNN